MIAINASVILATALDEPEAPLSVACHTRGNPGCWPTLVEARMVLAGRKFQNADTIIRQLAALPNLVTVAFDERHYFTTWEIVSPAVAAVAKVPLLFKGGDFSQTELKLHPGSSIT